MKQITSLVFALGLLVFSEYQAQAPFVQIAPILPDAVPILPAGILFLSGITGLCWMRRRTGPADAGLPAAA